MGIRTVSAVLYAAVLLSLAGVGGTAWALLVCLLCLLGVREAQALTQARGAGANGAIALAAALALPLVWLLRGPDHLLPALILVVLGAGIEQIARRPDDRRMADWLATIALPTAIAMPLAHLVGLRQLAWSDGRAAGPAWLFVVLGLVWANDTAAYLAGRAFGRRPFFPSISPKKTWEGAIGGVLACGLLGAALPGLAATWGGSLSMDPSMPLSALQGLGVGLLVAAMGTAGDLMESVLKRQAGVKDSGTLIPGHGGILDRVDSLIWVAPVAYYLVGWLTGGV